MDKGRYAFERSERVGGHPALDFVNSVHCWNDGRPGEEYLVDYAALARWHAVTGLLDARALRLLDAGSAASKRKAWARALELRDVLHRVFARLSARCAPAQRDLDALKDVLARTASWRRLVARASDTALPDIRVVWDFDGAPCAAILGPVAWSAAELLEHGSLDRIKACPPGDGCGWLFLDLSKNRSRTWCSMKTCGNTAKVRRFRNRR